MSGRGWCLGVVGLCAVLLAAPLSLSAPAPGEPAPPALVTLYAHWRDVVNRAPLNTIPPDPEDEPDINQGFQMPTLVLRTPCEPCDVTFQNNEFTLFTFPRETPAGSAIHYDVADPAYDVELADGPIFLYLYLSAHPVPSQNSTSELGALTNFGLMPLVRVTALWEAGREGGRGLPIARGESNQTINMIYVPGGDPVYEIVIPMGRFLETIPSGTGTVLTVRVHQVAADVAEVQQSNWRLRSGADYPWRLVVPVENVLVKRDLQAWSLADELHVRWGVKAAWGAYDIDASTFNLHLTSGGAVKDLAPTRVEYSPLHNPEIKTVYAHWTIPFADLPQSDEWHAKTTVVNLQKTTGLEAEQTVRLARYEGESSTPGFEGPLLALAAGLVAWAARRRST